MKHRAFTDAFIEAMFDHSFLSLINKLTRITDTSATYIDHKWTNCINCPITSAVITHLIADHMLMAQCSFFDEPKVKPAYILVIIPKTS